MTESDVQHDKKYIYKVSIGEIMEVIVIRNEIKNEGKHWVFGYNDRH